MVVLTNGRRPQHAVSKLPCLVLSSVISCRSSICPGRLSPAWLVPLVVVSCHLSYGLQLVTREVHRSSLRGLIYPAQNHFICLTVLIISMTLSSPWPRCWSFYLCMWCWAYFFPFWSVLPQVCSVLVWSVSRSLHHMPQLAAHRSCTPVSSGRWKCCFWRYPGVWRMPPSLPWFFVVSFCPGSFPWGCSVVPSTRSIGHFLSAHCSRL